MNYGVFLSYRRSDTAGHAGRIGDDLQRQFHRPVLFRDIDAIAVGADFVEALQQAIRAARVVIVLIGDNWLGIRGADGRRRLDDPGDHVRREVAMALDDDSLTVVPVLVEGAAMPSEGVLPKPLRRLARLQAIELSDQRWDYDMARLVATLAGAGIESAEVSPLRRWFAPLSGGVVIIVLALGIAWWQVSLHRSDDLLGLWHLPNGSFWSIRDKDGRLWVEETHYDSKQVWKRGAAELDGDVLEVQLELVFEQVPFRYLHRLRLTRERRDLIGSVRRSDREAETSLVLSRREP